MKVVVLFCCLCFLILLLLGTLVWLRVQEWDASKWQALDPIDAESLKLRDFKRDAHSPVLEVQETESYPHDKATRRKMLKQMERAANLETLELLAYRFNQLPPLNAKKFTLEEGHIPIVMLVHSRVLYFQHTVEQYRQVKNINKTVMVISHDGIFPEVLDLVLGIDFCQVKQLVFPYHLKWMKKLGVLPLVGYQVWLPNPGMLKLHWTWALTQAWYNIESSSVIDEVAYMEDDFFVTPDFYLALKAMVKLRDKVCTIDTCFTSVVGAHLFYLGANYKPSISRLTQTKFFCPKNSYTGISFSRERWESLRALYHQYCLLSNNHWDDGLHALMSGPKAQVPNLVLSTSFPRAIHAGRCGGVHFRRTGEQCNVTEDVRVFTRDYVSPVVQQLSRGMDMPQFEAPIHFDDMVLSCRKNVTGRRCYGCSSRRYWPPNYVKMCYHLSHPDFRHVTWGAGGILDLEAYIPTAIHRIHRASKVYRKLRGESGNRKQES